MKINFVNADRVHALVDLPTSLSIEEMIQIFEGSSSRWLNQGDLRYPSGGAPSGVRWQIAKQAPVASLVQLGRKQQLLFRCD